jgi:hypothetical protein
MPRTLGNSSSCQGVSSSTVSMSFLCQCGLPETVVLELIKLQSLVELRNGNPSSLENDTANWGGFVYYEESEVVNNGVKSQLLSKFPQSGLSFTLLDAGQALAQAPVWTELAWKNKSVKAGTIATL